LINSFIKCHVLGKNKEESDDLNHLCYLYQSEIVSPTIISKLAFWYWFKFRPYPSLPKDVIVDPATNAAQACMDKYFREKDQGPKLNEIYGSVNDFMYKTFSWNLKSKF
jgi:hypothetical protein